MEMSMYKELYKEIMFRVYIYIWIIQANVK